MADLFEGESYDKTNPAPHVPSFSGHPLKISLGNWESSWYRGTIYVPIERWEFHGFSTAHNLVSKVQ